MLWSPGTALLAITLAAGPLAAESPAVGPERGSVLIATERTRDAAFSQTVILLLQHDGLRSVGLVLNRPLGEMVPALFPDLRSSPAAADPLWAGGPVAIGINALLEEQKRSPATIVPGVALVSERQKIRELLARRTAGQQVRVFVGLCNWGRGQLDDEMSRGLWRAAAGSAHIVFASRPDTLWQRLSR